MIFSRESVDEVRTALSAMVAAIGDDEESRLRLDQQRRVSASSLPSVEAAMESSRQSRSAAKERVWMQGSLHARCVGRLPSMLPVEAPGPQERLVVEEISEGWCAEDLTLVPTHESSISVRIWLSVLLALVVAAAEPAAARARSARWRRAFAMKMIDGGPPLDLLEQVGARATRRPRRWLDDLRGESETF